MGYSSIGFFSDRRYINEVSIKKPDGTVESNDNEQDDNHDYTNMKDDDAPASDNNDNGGEQDDIDYTNMGDDDSPEPQSDDGGGDQQDDIDYTNMGDDDNESNDSADNGSDTSSGDDDSIDYTNMGDDESDEAGGDGEDSGGEDAGGSGEPSDGGDGESEEGGEGDGESSEEDELAKIEDELFADLTSEQNAIKDKELKRLFMELYKACDVSINRINAIAKTDDNMRVLTFCAKKLIELRDSIDFHINETYWTKLYLDNLITYKTCLAQYNNINNILAKLVPDDTGLDDIEDTKPKELDEYEDEDFEDDTKDTSDDSDSDLDLDTDKD